MMNKFNLNDAKLTHLLVLPGENFSQYQLPSSQKEREKMRNIPYLQAIRHVLWLVIDAMFQLNQLA
jgi:hypothetical protein